MTSTNLFFRQEQKKDRQYEKFELIFFPSSTSWMGAVNWSRNLWIIHGILNKVHEYEFLGPMNCTMNPCMKFIKNSWTHEYESRNCHESCEYEYENVQTTMNHFMNHAKYRFIWVIITCEYKRRLHELYEFQALMILPNSNQVKH